MVARQPETNSGRTDREAAAVPEIGADAAEEGRQLSPEVQAGIGQISVRPCVKLGPKPGAVSVTPKDTRVF